MQSITDKDGGTPQCDGWQAVLEGIRTPDARFLDPWELLFAPLRRRGSDPLAVAQLGQSLDGRIATPTGHSFDINGPDGLDHLHRLRALVDGVLVGIGTAVTDDPRLTVRRVAGASPARIVLDPNGRLPACARVLEDDGIRRLIVTAETTKTVWDGGVEVIRVPRGPRGIAPKSILAALTNHGLPRILVEGGAATVSGFLAAGALDRLHVVVAPMILGSGPTGLGLPPIERADQGLRVPISLHRLGDEVLFDCDLSDHAGAANRST